MLDFYIEPTLRKQFPGLRFEVLTITPDLAREWLTRLAENQRPKYPSTIFRYAADMKLGRFLLNFGATVVFSTHGELLEGQQRLNACVTAGEPFPAIVVYGCPNDEHMAVLGLAKARTVADQIHASDASLKDEHKVASTAGSIHAAVYRFATRSKVFSLPLGTKERADAIRADVLFFEAARFALPYKSTPSQPSLVSPLLAGAVYYLATFAGYDSETIEAFLNSVALARGVQAKDATDRARVRLQKIKGNATPDISQRLGILISAFGLFADNRDRKIARFDAATWPDLSGLDRVSLCNRVGASALAQPSACTNGY